jgi:hypothetical protein
MEWIGPVIITIVIIVAIPVSVLVSGGIGAAIIGWVLRTDVDSRHQDSELLDLNG